ncbi:MAG: dTDP-4-dehydrorhamnose 3,5-epimerase [Planctomycetaceae bacterium]
MKFLPTKFHSAWLIEPDGHEDERGFFARTWCQREFEQRGLNADLVQCSISFNRVRGTLRGMHFQAAPHEEAKLVRCTQGSIFDVIVDVRRESPTCGDWQSFELSSKNRKSLLIPEGFAHGFQTLEPDSEILYQMSEFYHPGSARGFHHADPQIRVSWPLHVEAISQKDSQLPPLSLEEQQAAA